MYTRKETYNLFIHKLNYRDNRAEGGDRGLKCSITFITIITVITILSIITDTVLLYQLKKKKIYTYNLLHTHIKFHVGDRDADDHKEDQVVEDAPQHHQVVVIKLPQNCE